uniref:ARF GTPase-activating protein GIT2 n=1 Tax=Cacopsylla melanoneura TaxID=428564 RepID=A0A8D9AIG4_9HEMI
MCSKTKICADCSATDPKWGILNKGVFVCDACCSIHRSLGRHISQVKYLDSSTWPPSLLSMLMTLTNGGANCLWEHSLCESKANKNQKKPSSSDPLQRKAEFIKAKYEQLSFVLRSSDTEEDLNQQLHSSVRTSNLDPPKNITS